MFVQIIDRKKEKPNIFLGIVAGLSLRINSRFDNQL